MALTQREAFARLMEHLCSHDGNDGHGYSQPNRAGVGKEIIDLSDGVKVVISGGDRDCSSAICTSLRAVGIDIYGASYTGNMLNIAKNPLFKAYKRPTDYSAKRGDIYLNTSHHTAMCTHGFYEAGGDKLCQFSISEKGTITGATGDQTGKESNFKNFYDYPWTHTIAWVSDGATVSGTLDYFGLGTDGSTSGSASTGSTGLGDKRYWGPKFTREMQRQLGTTVDGIVSNQSMSDKAALPNAERSSWQFNNGKGGSAMVKALQKKVGATVDGYCGKKTVIALQKWLVKKGYSVGSSGADGSLGPSTCEAVGKALEDGVFRA